MKLIIEPADGVAPLLSAIKSAKKSLEIAIFRFDRKDVETCRAAGRSPIRTQVQTTEAFVRMHRPRI